MLNRILEDIKNKQTCYLYNEEMAFLLDEIGRKIAPEDIEELNLTLAPERDLKTTHETWKWEKLTLLTQLKKIYINGIAEVQLGKKMKANFYPSLSYIFSFFAKP